MSRVLALVEGETELAFVKQVLAPELTAKGVHLSATKIGSARGKSGIRPYASNRGDILAALKQESAQYCTTMLDYYGMPDDWPGRIDARSKTFSERALTVERKLHADISEAMGTSFHIERFVPYVQMHEFEALLYSNPRILAEVLQEPHLEREFAEIVRRCGSPEQIDDDPNTAPSKRIKALAKQYEKGAQAALLTQRIGLGALRKCCPHFSEWVQKLESLSQQGNT